MGLLDHPQPVIVGDRHDIVRDLDRREAHASGLGEVAISNLHAPNVDSVFEELAARKHVHGVVTIGRDFGFKIALRINSGAAHLDLADVRVGACHLQPVVQMA